MRRPHRNPPQLPVKGSSKQQYLTRIDVHPMPGYVVGNVSLNGGSDDHLLEVTYGRHEACATGCVELHRNVVQNDHRVARRRFGSQQRREGEPGTVRTTTTRGSHALTGRSFNCQEVVAVGAHERDAAFLLTAGCGPGPPELSSSVSRETSASRCWGSMFHVERYPTNRAWTRERAGAMIEETSAS